MTFLPRMAMVAAVFFALTGNGQAATLSSESIETSLSATGKTLAEFKDASLRSIRLIQEKQQQQMEIEALGSQRRARAMVSETVSSESVASDPTTQTADLSAGQTQPVIFLQSTAGEAQAVSASEMDAIYAELVAGQQDSPLGLVVSYNRQAGLENQAFTYDQAVAGIVMLKQGDTASAAKILDFFKSQWDGSGLYTVYNAQTLNGWTIEQEKILGPNAWIALLAVQYHVVTGDASALDFAVEIARWAMTLPHTQGGVSMGEAGTDWVDRYSVENNLSYYAVTRLLASMAPDDADRAAIAQERDQLKQWLGFPGFDSSAVLFRRGAYLDSLKALDTNSWGILALGVSGLSDLGVDADALVAATERQFLVRSVDGYSFYGGDPLSAKGFDFSTSTNSFMTRGRTALKWVEGTAQMVTVYRFLADAYALSDPALSADYAARADHFIEQNGAQRVQTAAGVSYTYAEYADMQIYFDIPSWRTAAGPSVAAAAWVYFSLYGFNPFAPMV